MTAASVGIANFGARRAEITAAQARLGFVRKDCRYSPRYVAFLRKPAFAVIFGRKSVSWGKQDVLLAGSKTWVLPNPSGLNRPFGIDELVRAYTELRIALDGVSK